MPGSPGRGRLGASARLALAALLLAGCGADPPALPPAEPAPTIAATGDAATGARLFTDRGYGRTGLACADCHPTAESPLRPAPALGPWAAGDARWAGRSRAPAEALAACVERFQARGAPSPSEAGHLRVAAASGPVDAAVPDDPEALYRAACLHCHEGGPAGPITGRRWLRGAVRAALRAPRGPDRLMPRFDPSTLPDPAAERLVEWLVGIAAESATLTP